VDTKIYMVRTTRAQYPTSTGELSCIAQACMSLSLPICPPAWTGLFFDPCEEVSTPSFYHSRSGSYNETRGPTGGPEVVETLYNI
jgi:hypothetical protein